ncbi:MAG TPA: S9 family peptidase [Vicinamibacterales bacterium]|nr:S9 family peptidase [Vicinamibacterales bacterium]
MTRTLVVLLLLAPALAEGANEKVPTVDQMIELKRAAAPAISPDGRHVAFTIREADWEENAFDTEIWLVDAQSPAPRQLTRGRRTSTSPGWSPDGTRLAFASDRGEKRQIYLIDPTGGEAQALTSAEDGVGAFSWSPDGRHIAFSAAEPKTQAAKDRDKKYGEFVLVDEDRNQTHLWIIDVQSRETRQLTKGQLVVGTFRWSPDGSLIAYDHRVDNDPSNSGSADISIVEVASGESRLLVTQEGPDANPRWSPDGARIAFETAMSNPAYYYTNGLIAAIPAAGGPIDVLTRAFDEDPSLIAWSPDGIYFSAAERTWAHLYRLDPASRQVTRLPHDPQAVAAGFSFSRDFRRTAYVSSGAAQYPEVFVADLPAMNAKKLTDLGAQLGGWALGRSEVISWTSRDGARIEGVLHKPPDFVAGRRYPLLVVIHGGPTGISRPALFPSTGVYPINIWLSRGALVLEPNYRGSAGYGEKFRALNVRNLGVGDAWDVVSGIDHLVAQGFVDASRVGAMGWSQGGYISAFLTTHDSARFKAISVGAGISDWMTYYVNTDIHPFTRMYLKATPWDDPEIYRKTSPITYIKQARTPTLIQHGENDQRVPIPNAFELYQGLRDQNVPTRLVVYKGFGHGLTKPKAVRAAMEHNLEWFDKYIWSNTKTN